jgi:hypothetical protein
MALTTSDRKHRFFLTHKDIAEIHIKIPQCTRNGSKRREYGSAAVKTSSCPRGVCILGGEHRKQTITIKSKLCMLAMIHALRKTQEGVLGSVCKRTVSLKGVVGEGSWSRTT